MHYNDDGFAYQEFGDNWFKPRYVDIVSREHRMIQGHEIVCDISEAWYLIRLYIERFNRTVPRVNVFMHHDNPRDIEAFNKMATTAIAFFEYDAHKNGYIPDSRFKLNLERP